MAMCDAPIPKGLYSDGKHWIYFKIERRIDVIQELCHQFEGKSDPEFLIEITSITLYDFGKVSVSEMTKLMKEFLLPFKQSKTLVVWKLSADHNKRLTVTRKRMFMDAQESIARACGFHNNPNNLNGDTNKYYYYA